MIEVDSAIKRVKSAKNDNAEAMSKLKQSSKDKMELYKMLDDLRNSYFINSKVTDSLKAKINEFTLTVALL